MSTTAAQIIDNARIRHWAFPDIALGDGALVLFINQRIRTLLATYGAQIEGLTSVSVQYPIPITTQMVKLNAQGVPYLTAGDGWPVHITNTPFAGYQTGYSVTIVGGVPTITAASVAVTADPFGQQFDDFQQVPYLDTYEAPVGVDPFGVHGGTPGFPLPFQMVRLTAVSVMYGPGTPLLPCAIIAQASRLQTLPGRDLAVFVSGNRLIPLESHAPVPSGSRWRNVTAIQLTYVPLPLVRVLGDTVALPSVLLESLIADCAVFLARQSAKVAAAERASFEAEAERCSATLQGASIDMLNDSQSSSVVYRG